MEDFKVLFEQVEEAEHSVGESERTHLAVLGSQNVNIAELMMAAQELVDLEPSFFTRA